MSIQTSVRRDWLNKGCPVVAAADPQQAKMCPNNRYDMIFS